MIKFEQAEHEFYMSLANHTTSTDKRNAFLGNYH
jgi:hypothetical protein